MKYLCLIYFDERRHEALSALELAMLDLQSTEYNTALAERSQCLAATVLKPVDTATTVRLHNGRPAVTDGPCARTREQLGGFVFIEAGNLDEAIAIASGIPALRLGCVEIRAAREPGNGGRREA